MAGFQCRVCASKSGQVVIDLGTSPPSNAYVTEVALKHPEKYFPLKVWICHSCWLVQAEAYSRASHLFDEEYAYFSSFSSHWLRHSEEFALDAINRFSLNSESLVAEIGSNDGYLLQYFLKAGIPVLGVEPTRSTATVSRGRGIPTVEKFFGESVARELATKFGRADLICANNVIAHVPDLMDMCRGISLLLGDGGSVSIEFPHLVNLVSQNQFDTIYHEHFCYFSFSRIEAAFNEVGLEVFDVKEINTHGGSLRVHLQHQGGQNVSTDAVRKMRLLEDELQINNPRFYDGFQIRADKVKNDLLSFLVNAKNANKKVIGYGAAAKGNTLLNYGGVKKDLVEFVVDKNPAKVGKYLPGSRIPILEVEQLINVAPDFVLILPWNLRSEVIDQLTGSLPRHTTFVVAVPELTFFPNS